VKERLLGFVDALRAAGIPVTVSEVLDAMGAVGTIGFAREAFRETLAATLIKDHADRPHFDALFDRYFGIPLRRESKGERRQRPGEGEGQSGPHRNGQHAAREQPETPPRSARATTQPRRPPEGEQRRERPRSEAGERLAHHRALRQRPFEEMSPNDADACDALVLELARRFRAHLSRRHARSPRGRLDIRRTIRRAISKGGVLIDPAFRRRRPGRPDLIVLCDHSHSVATASRFLLSLIIPARQFFRRVRLFAYVDQPVEVSVEAGHLVPHDRLDLYARSDFGSVLTSFYRQYDALLSRNAIVLILGDARNNRRPPRTDILARVRSLVRQVIWLNPEPLQRWNSGDSVIAAYARHCDVVLGSSSVGELYTALKQVFRAL
jgi:uncharacterized protein with von Willebrand factor type A (vWA) domain